MLGPEQSGRLPRRVPPTFKDDAKRLNPAQRLAEAVVILRGAVSPGEHNPHFYVAKSPVLPGVNPLLLVVEDPGGMRTFRRVLAILPAWKIHVEPCDLALYKAALGRVYAKYRDLIDDLAASKLPKLLPVEIVDGRHAGNGIPLWLSEQLADFVKEAKENDVSTRLLSPISDLLRLHPDNDPCMVRWDVLHLQYDEPDITSEPDWHIFTKWEGWIERKLSSRDCLDEYKKLHQLHGNLNAFSTHLRYLGLPVPLKEGVKPRRKRKR